MTKELEKVCKEYDFNEDMAELAEVVEEVYNYVNKEDKGYSMVEWIKVNTVELPYLDNMTDKEKFLYGFGRLITILEEVFKLNQ